MKRNQYRIAISIVILFFVIGGVAMLMTSQSPPSDYNGEITAENTPPIGQVTPPRVPDGNQNDIPMPQADENYQQLGDIFATAGETLAPFVEFIAENDLIDSLRRDLRGLVVDFDLEEARGFFHAGRHDDLITIYNGELVRSLTDDDPFYFLMENPELFFLLDAIRDQGIIRSIHILGMAPDTWIEFELYETYTEFIWPMGWPAWFTFLKNTYYPPEMLGYTQIEGYWHMRIMGAFDEYS